MIKQFLKLWVFVLVILVSNSSPYAKTRLSADEALERLQAGNQRFVTGQMMHPHQDEGRRTKLKQGQSPFATILGCSDSRVPPKIIFDQGLGDLFIIRVAGNTPDDFVLGSLEYGAVVLKVPLIMVLGHEKCGAVEASLKKGALPGHIEEIAKAIRPAIQENTCKKQEQASCAIKNNVGFVVEKLKKSQPILAPLVESGQLKVVGAVYDLATGKVTLLP